MWSETSEAFKRGNKTNSPNLLISFLCLLIWNAQSLLIPSSWLPSDIYEIPCSVLYGLRVKSMFPRAPLSYQQIQTVSSHNMEPQFPGGRQCSFHIIKSPRSCILFHSGRRFTKQCLWSSNVLHRFLRKLLDDLFLQSSLTWPPWDSDTSPRRRCTNDWKHVEVGSAITYSFFIFPQDNFF